MAKRPTPKKRRAKSAGRAQYSMYCAKQRRKLANRRNSPYAVIADPKKDKTVEKVTKIKA